MGVHEYFILDARGRYMTFYRRTPSGDYDHITPDDDGVIQSEVLPSFRFRVADIYRKPSMLAMAEDAVYQDFVEASQLCPYDRPISKDVTSVDNLSP